MLYSAAYERLLCRVLASVYSSV